MTNLYAKALPVKKPRRVPIKCSTCADRTCRVRGQVINWKHCYKWKPGERSNEQDKT